MATEIINEISKKRNSESGHAQNVANLEDFITVCIGYGASFNPSNENLKITALQTIQTSALNSLQSVKEAKTNLDNAKNLREIIFSTIKKLSTKILNALDATQAKKQTVDDARTIHRKIQGIKAPKKEKATEQPNTNPDSIPSNEIQGISSSQQGFDSLVEHLTKLIQTISSEPLYKPNETELKVITLKTLLTDMKSSNTAVINTQNIYDNTLILRNRILYQPLIGLIDITNDVKHYVKSIFGVNSPEYKLISRIKFKKRKI